MGLEPGRRLGPDEVVAPIGAGGRERRPLPECEGRDRLVRLAMLQ